MQNLTLLKAAKIIAGCGEELLVGLLCRQARQIASSKRTITLLQKKIRLLEGRLAINSHNSNLPPSSDRFYKPCPKSLKVKTGKKSGGQIGHPGRTLMRVDDPYERIVHSMAQCAHCGISLADETPSHVEKRQVFDLPPIRLRVTEHEVQTKRCPHCHHLSEAKFPEEVSSPAQYGPRIRSIIVYLKTYQLLPFKRTTLLLRDLFGAALSEGTLANTTDRCSGKADEPLKRISEALIRSPVAHFDETGCRVSKCSNWLHVASTKKLTYMDVRQCRGSKAMNEIGILPEFKGRAVHDGFVSYHRYGNMLHALCNAHHLRELTYADEVEGQQWAKGMKRLLIDIKNTIEERKQGGQKSLDESEIEEFENSYRLLLDVGYGQNPLEGQKDIHKRGIQKRTKIRNLVERLDKRKREALAFMYDFEVPFDNNLAERDIRMMRVQQKISGTFRSFGGAEDFCRIRSYLSTAGKNNIDPMEAISTLFAGKPFMPVIQQPAE